ncbi:hypothetical protein C5167_000457 [Papaver somniferum]|uniref:Uncharacterized protein n=1 Tax=Papaver somniferum TaxID=3469 RepID=A0A4Y7KSJ9_PAPSO|nr:hypothetical protein C5167_000457 [Papaver somniferum]
MPMSDSVVYNYMMEGGGGTVALPPKKSVITQLQTKWGELENGYKGWVSKQCLPVEIATVAATHAFQGAAFGVLLGNILKNFRPFQKYGSIPLIVSLARNFALLRGTNGAMTCGMKRIRGGKDDTKARTVAGFTSGFMTSVIDDFPSPPNISIGIGIGLLFAVLNGLLHKVLSSQQPVLDDRCYTRTRCMLSKLGLQKYEKHFKKHFDLAEARIPLGPRVLILNHIERGRDT